MKIVADENIAQVAAYFAGAGELVLLPGRAIDAPAVKDADALLVRSVTTVDAKLLTGSRCRFVGTATSGIDHVDMNWLQQQGINFGWAQSCNADSVVDYVFSALAHLSERDGCDWRALSFGIAGCGQIGGRLAHKLRALGLRVAIHDPFLDKRHALSGCFTDFATVLQQDIVTFHTPLTRTGAWPTWHLLDAKGLARLQPDTILINAARGAVIDNAALLAHIRSRPEQRVVLDAWENEPGIDLELLRRVRLGTAHIAGYSQEGKLNGTRMIAAEFSRHFDVKLPRVKDESGQAVALKAVDQKLSALRQLNGLILQACDVGSDDTALRQSASMPDPAAQFDLLRKQYPVRREFSACRIPAGLVPDTATQALVLGFLVA